jgi:hypothetical protein
MTDAELSAAMKQLAERRWRGQVSSRLARELMGRVDELPPIEKRALMDALNRPAGQELGHGAP